MFLFRDKKNKLIPRKGLKDAQSSFKLRSFVSSPWCSSFFHTPLLSSFYVEIFFRKIKASFFFYEKKNLPPLSTQRRSLLKLVEYREERVLQNSYPTPPYQKGAKMTRPHEYLV